MAPDFYRLDRDYLQELCDKLQAFYERKLLKEDGQHYTKLLIEMPPQHGKSRTLIYLCSWILGLNQEERIITGSYNDDMAQDFSKYTRDTIMSQSNVGEIVYSDIFKSQLKQGDASAKQWALKGQFFNYKGCGIGGSVTGKGATFRIIDDPVKSAEIAYNENALDKIWLWYTGTWLSRRGASEVMDIVCNTPWAKKDLSGRLLDIEPDEWYRITMPVITDDVMLCDSLLHKKDYEDIKRVADENIFAANYLMERLDLKGRLYNNLLTYDKLPVDVNGNSLATQTFNYTDTADEGDDWLCSICAEKYESLIYLTDILFTKVGQEITEPETAELLERAETKQAMIESNNGGRGFARNVIRHLKDNEYRCSVRWFHQSKNKRARILTNAANVQNYVRFPVDWAIRWPEFYKALTSYQKEGKNKHDDAPDAITGIVEYMGKGKAKIVRW